MKIIYEDKDILVCVKPAGTATQTAGFAAKDMVSEVKNYLVQKGADRNPYLGVVHRLDQPVSGILVFGKTKKGSSVKLLKKEYTALVFGILVEKEGTLRHYLWKDPISKRAVVFETEKEALECLKKSSPKKSQGDLKKEIKEAVLTYRVLERRENTSLVSVELITGRFHQIRAQFSAIGHPLLGDVKYGSEESKELSMREHITNVSLCARGLTILHPVTNKKMEFSLQKEDISFENT